MGVYVPPPAVFNSGGGFPEKKLQVSGKNKQ